MVNLADLYRSMNEDVKAEPLLRQALAAQPGYAPAYHALGLLLVRAHDMAGALGPLKSAADLAPESAHFAYVYAIALNAAHRFQEAVATLQEASARHPADVDILTALVMISRDNGDQAGAIRYAEQFVKAAPNNSNAQASLNALRGRQ